MLKLPDLSAPSLNLTAHALNIGTNEIDVPHFPSPRKQPEHMRTEQEQQAARGWGRIGQQPNKVGLSDAYFFMDLGRP